MDTHADRTGLRGQIKLLYDHRNLIERLFGEREMFVHTSEVELLDTIQQLQKARLVRVEVQHNGRTVRLSRATLEFCRLSSRRARIERMTLDIEDVFEAVDTHLAAWLQAEREGRIQDALETQDLIEEQIEDVEHGLAEKIENVNRDIDAQYGFDERADIHIQRFRHYHARLHRIQEEARELTHRLGAEEYQKHGFLARLANRLNGRFQEHAKAMSRLDDRLGQFISLLERRRNRTRRSIVFRRWLSQQARPIRFPMAEAQANTIPLMRRADPLRIGGFPDLRNPFIRDACKDIARDVIRRTRKKRPPQSRKQRPASGQALDTQAMINEVREAEATFERNRWDEHRWMDDFITRAIDRCLDDPEHRESAMSYWHAQINAAGHDEGGSLPAARTWLNEVVNMTLNNRPFEGRPLFDSFFVDFIHRTDDHDSRQSPLRMQDVHLQLRPAMRQAITRDRG